MMFLSVPVSLLLSCYSSSPSIVELHCLLSSASISDSPPMGSGGKAVVRCDSSSNRLTFQGRDHRSRTDQDCLMVGDDNAELQAAPSDGLVQLKASLNACFMRVLYTLHRMSHKQNC